MTRIAKPGAPVIIENTAPPLCAEHHDWGGVTQDWYVQRARDNIYNWDVDPSSMVFEDAQTFSHRYHLFMKKNL